MVRLVLALSLLLTACSGPEPRGGPRGVASVGTSLRPAPAVAAALAASLEHERGGALADGVTPRRVGRLARDLAKAGGARLVSITITGSAEGDLHLFPGQRLQIARGLLELLAAKAPSQPHLAGVLAHATAHLVLGHVDAALERRLRAAGVPALPGRVSPFQNGTADPAAAAAVGRALTLLRAPRFDAETCLAADRLAVRSLARLGYPTRTLREAWSHLAAAEARDSRSLTALVGSHGALGLRVAAAGQAARDVGKLPARGEPTLQLDLAPLRAEARRASVALAAERLARRGFAQEAERILASDPKAAESPIGARARARLLAAKNESRPTERTLRAVLLLRPADHAARLLLTRHYLGQANREAARAELQALLKRAPFLAEAHLLSGRATDDPSRARAWFRLARALDPEQGPVARAAAEALGDDPGASPPGKKDPKRTRIMSGG